VGQRRGSPGITDPRTDFLIDVIGIEIEIAIEIGAKRQRQLATDYTDKYGFRGNSKTREDLA
jgi:hypothetical protein